MARIRSLKIGFFTNETLCSLSPWHRLLFEGLWLLADREGRLEDRPRRIKALLFPYDAVDVDGLLTELAEKDFVVRYTADGAACADGAPRYLAIPHFCLHQRPKSDEYASVIPAPRLEIPRGISRRPRLDIDIDRDLDRGSTETGSENDATNVAGADGVPPMERVADADGVSGRVRAEDRSDLDAGADGVLRVSQADAFVRAWNAETWPPIPRCRELTTKRRRQIRSRLTERGLDAWRKVFQRIQASAFCRGESRGGTGWRATFDWVIGSPDVAVKVLEGKYDDREEVGAGMNKSTASVVAALRRKVEYD